MAGWLNGKLCRALKVGIFPVGTQFFSPIDFLIFGKEVDSQDEIFTEVFEYMNATHKFLLVNFKWDRVHTLTFNLVFPLA
jgi:hypothetical protein